MAALTAMDGDEVRAVLLEILDDVDSFCRDQGIPYVLYAGTLLGCVRHQGFIPWDDDVDVMMARPDYERFCASFPESDRYRLVHAETHRSFPYASAKVSRIGTCVVEEVDLAESDRFGVSVDVLPYDVAPSSALVFRLQVALAWAVRAVLLLKVVQASSSRSAAVRLMLRVTRALFAPVPVGSLVRARARIAQLCRRQRTGFVTMLIASVPWRVPVDWIEPPDLAPFEGRDLPVPANTHEFLTAVYGDYATPPPVAEQVAPHLAVAYRVSEG